MFDVVVYDLDHLLPWRDEILARLSNEPCTASVAVHGYNLTAEQVKALVRVSQ